MQVNFGESHDVQFRPHAFYKCAVLPTTAILIEKNERLWDQAFKAALTMLVLGKVASISHLWVWRSALWSSGAVAKKSSTILAPLQALSKLEANLRDSGSCNSWTKKTPRWSHWYQLYELKHGEPWCTTKAWWGWEWCRYHWWTLLWHHSGLWNPCESIQK